MMSLNNKRASRVVLVYNCPLVVYREAMERLFSYAKSLTAASKERYKEKISLIGGLDPFLKDETSLSLHARALRTVIAA